MKVSLAKPMTKGKKKTDAHPVVKEAHIPKPKTIRSELMLYMSINYLLERIKMKDVVVGL